MLSITSIRQFLSLTNQQQADILNGLHPREQLLNWLEKKRPKLEIEPHWVKCNKCSGSGQIFLEPRDNNGIHASQIHLCKRKLWFDVKGYGNHHQAENSGKLNLIFDHGTALHEMLQGYGSKGAWGPNYFPEIKLLPTQEQCVAKGLPAYPLALKHQIKSSVDAAVYQVQVDNVTSLGSVLVDTGHEYKSIGSNGYKQLTDAKAVHKMQGTLYQAVLDIPIMVYIYYDKDHDDIKCYPTKFDGYIWAEVEDKIQEVLFMADQEDAVAAIPDHKSSGVLNPVECIGGPYTSACMYYGKICHPPIKQAERTEQVIPVEIVKKRGRPKKNA